MRPILGRPNAKPGCLNPESVARALPRALPVFRRASDFAPPRFKTSIFPGISRVVRVLPLCRSSLGLRRQRESRWEKVESRILHSLIQGLIALVYGL